MAGETTSGSLADSMPLIIDAARIRREYPPIVAKLFEYHKLPEGTGLSWEEAELSRFTAQAITETTRLTNYQQYADTLRVVTPTVSGLATLVTDLVLARMSKVVRAEMGTMPNVFYIAAEHMGEADARHYDQHIRVTTYRSTRERR